MTAAVNCSKYPTPTPTSGLWYKTYPTDYFPRRTAAPTEAIGIVSLDSTWMDVPDDFLAHFPEYKPYNSNCSLGLQSVTTTGTTVVPVVQLGLDEIVAILEKENCAPGVATSIANAALSADATDVPSLLLGC